jgi:hypothetical protein
MTEDQWLKERGHPQGMVWALRQQGKLMRTKVGRRKLRLFACGCCRLLWGQMHDPRLREAVEAAERFAEGQGSKEELDSLHTTLRRLTWGAYQPGDPRVRERTAAAMAVATTHAQPFEAAITMTVYPDALAGRKLGKMKGDEALCHLLRCVFGNPFRPVSLDPAWRTPGLRALAEAAYQERSLPDGALDATRLGVLADALEDAGCAEVALVEHCRSPGLHVRGCWVVDLLTGRG